MPDLEISKLPPISGALLQAADPLALADLSASETKKVTVKDLVQGGIALIDDGSIPGQKVNFTVPPGSIGTTELADKSVTAAKLDDQSSAIVALTLPATGAYIGQLAYNEDTGKAYIWDGTTWEPFKAAGSVNTLTYNNALGPIAIGGVVTDDNIELSVLPKDTTAGGLFMAGPVTTGGAVDYRRIFSSDLPTASTDKGAVAVAGNGLIMIGDAIAIDNVVDPSAGTFSLVEYNSYGLVIDGRAITSVDLPIASIGDIGAIRPGPEFLVSASGELAHSNAVTPGTATKITYDGSGHVTNGTNLTADDIPEVSVDALVGQITTDQLAECSVTAPKICDYATCLMQEANPGAGDFLGQFWYTPSTAQLRVYSRGSGPENIWLPVGFGALQANNLRWGGTYNADTDQLGVLTSLAVSEGLKAGQPFPAPTDAMSGIYFICQVDGSSMTQPNLNGISHTAGDWAVCLDQAQGWVHIDANSGGGGGGGGGAQYLNDLLDVEIGGSGGPFSTAPSLALSNLNLFKYDGGEGKWKNTDRIDGGSY